MASQKESSLPISNYQWPCYFFLSSKSHKSQRKSLQISQFNPVLRVRALQQPCHFYVHLTLVSTINLLRNVLMSVCLQKDELEQEAPYSAYLVAWIVWSWMWCGPLMMRSKSGEVITSWGNGCWNPIILQGFYTSKRCLALGLFPWTVCQNMSPFLWRRF